MTEFKQLVKEGKVSKCGRWLEKPCNYPNIIFRAQTLEARGRTHSIWQNKPNQLHDLRHGLIFYSKAHAELARDTMEVEQICRKHYPFDIPRTCLEKIVEYKNNCGLNDIYQILIDRFGEERLKEILNQELS